MDSNCKTIFEKNTKGIEYLKITNEEYPTGEYIIVLIKNDQITGWSKFIIVK